MSSPFIKRTLFENTIFICVGGICAFLLADGFCVPMEKTTLILQALGGLSAISGSLVSWSLGWVSQSRTIIREIDYYAVRILFSKLEGVHNELIRRWVVVLACSATVILFTILVVLSKTWVYILTPILLIAKGNIAFLFWRMFGLSALKTELDNFEYKEVRKKRNIPPDIDSQEYKSLSKT